MYSSSGRREKAVERLLHGHGCAHRLKAWFDSNSSSPLPNDASVPVEQLSSAIFDSFSDALSIVLDADLSQDTVISLPHHQPRCSTASRKGNAEERVELRRDDSPVPIYYDGFIWRKYGQKDIRQSKHRRSYYRCTYGDVCKAKKHVQKIRDNPAVYRTTYFGQHTCQNHLPNLHILSGPNDQGESAGSGTIISFDKHHHQDLPSTSSVNQKHQEMEREKMQMGRQELWYPPSPGTMMFETPAAFIDLEDLSDNPLTPGY